MNSRTLSKSIFSLKQVLSSLIILCFASNSVFGAVPVTVNSLGETSKEITGSFPADLNAVELPKALGKIQESFKGDKKETVLILQDAHAIPEAQKSLRKIMDYFQKEYGVSLVALEGAASLLDAQLFKSFPDKKKLEDVFGEYHQNGELAAGSASAIFNSTPAFYQGIEDWELYQTGLVHYLQALQKEPLILQGIEEKRRKNVEAKAKIYSPELQKVDQAVQNFRANNASIIELLEVLTQVKSPADGSEIYLLWEEIRKNKQSSNSSIENEVKTLSGKVNTFLKQKASESQKAQEILTEFNQKAQEFQTSRLQPETFALWMKEKIKGIAFSRSLDLLMQDQRRLRDLEGTKLFNDLEAYIRDTKSILLNTPELKQLDNESESLHLFEKFAKLELSREEWNQVKNLEAPSFDSQMAFYQNSESREGAFLEKLQSIFNEHSTKKQALLVAGGFHAQGLAHKFKERGISYLLISPAIQSLPEENNYRDHMQGDVSWKSYFKMEEGKLDLHAAFVRGTRDKLLAANKGQGASGKGDSLAALTLDSSLLKGWRDQILRDLADQNRLDQAGQYTQYLDELSQGPKKESPILQRAQNFIAGLRRLKDQNQITDRNIFKLLLQTPTVPDVVTSPAAAVGDAEVTNLQLSNFLTVGVSSEALSSARVAAEIEARMALEVRAAAPQVQVTRSEQRALSLSDGGFSITLTRTGKTLTLRDWLSRDGVIDYDVIIISHDDEKREIKLQVIVNEETLVERVVSASDAEFEKLLGKLRFHMDPGATLRQFFHDWVAPSLVIGGASILTWLIAFSIGLPVVIGLVGAAVNGFLTSFLLREFLKPQVIFLGNMAFDLFFFAWKNLGLEALSKNAARRDLEKFANYLDKFEGIQPAEDITEAVPAEGVLFQPRKWRTQFNLPLVKEGKDIYEFAVALKKMKREIENMRRRTVVPDAIRHIAAYDFKERLKNFIAEWTNAGETGAQDLERFVKFDPKNPKPAVIQLQNAIERLEGAVRSEQRADENYVWNPETRQFTKAAEKIVFYGGRKLSGIAVSDAAAIQEVIAYLRETVEKSPRRNFDFVPIVDGQRLVNLDEEEEGEVSVSTRLKNIISTYDDEDLLFTFKKMVMDFAGTKDESKVTMSISDSTASVTEIIVAFSRSEQRADGTLDKFNTFDLGKIPLQKDWARVEIEPVFDFAGAKAEFDGVMAKFYEETFRNRNVTAEDLKIYIPRIKFEDFKIENLKIYPAIIAEFEDIKRAKFEALTFKKERKVSDPVGVRTYVRWLRTKLESGDFTVSQLSPFSMALINYYRVRNRFFGGKRDANRLLSLKPSASQQPLELLEKEIESLRGAIAELEKPEYFLIVSDPSRGVLGRAKGYLVKLESELARRSESRSEFSREMLQLSLKYRRPPNISELELPVSDWSFRKVIGGWISPLFRGQTNSEQMREESLNEAERDLNIRLETNPIPTSEEVLAGNFKEAIEPEVRDAVFVLRQKGINTRSSGWGGEEVQYSTIAGYGLTQEQADAIERSGLAEVNKLLTDYQKGYPDKFNEPFVISFLVAGMNREQIKNRWDEIVKLVPSGSKQVERSRSYGAIQFRWKYAPPGTKYLALEEYQSISVNTVLEVGDIIRRGFPWPYQVKEMLKGGKKLRVSVLDTDEDQARDGHLFIDRSEFDGGFYQRPMRSEQRADEYFVWDPGTRWFTKTTEKIVSHENRSLSEIPILDDQGIKDVIGYLRKIVQTKPKKNFDFVPKVDGERLVNLDEEEEGQVSASTRLKNIISTYDDEDLLYTFKKMVMDFAGTKDESKVTVSISDSTTAVIEIIVAFPRSETRADKENAAKELQQMETILRNWETKDASGKYLVSEQELEKVKNTILSLLGITSNRSIKLVTENNLNGSAISKDGKIVVEMVAGTDRGRAIKDIELSFDFPNAFEIQLGKAPPSLLRNLFKILNQYPSHNLSILGTTSDGRWVVLLHLDSDKIEARRGSPGFWKPYRESFHFWIGDAQNLIEIPITDRQSDMSGTQWVDLGGEMAGQALEDKSMSFPRGPITLGKGSHRVEVENIVRLRLENRSEQGYRTQTVDAVAGHIAAALIEETKGRSEMLSVASQTVQVINEDIIPFDEFSKLVMEAVQEKLEELEVTGAAGLSVDKALAQAAVSFVLGRIAGALRDKGLEGKVGIAIDRNIQDPNLFEALQQMKGLIGMVFLDKEKAKGLDRQKLAGLVIQPTNLQTLRSSPAVANSSAIPLLMDKKVDYLAAHQVLFGITAQGQTPNEPFFEVAADIFDIALGIYAASLMTSPKDLQDEEKRSEIRAELLRVFFAELGSPDVIGFDKEGNFIVNRALLMRFVTEHLAQAQIKTAA